MNNAAYLQSGSILSTFVKPLAALAVSLLVFAGFSLLPGFQLADLIQTRFYNPSVVSSYINENKIDSEIAQNYLIELHEKFSDSLKEHAVRSSFLYNQSADDIYERSRIFGTLIESVSALQSVQFVDTNGLRIHFSTSTRDIFSQSRASTSYRNYNENSAALPYETVSVPDGSNPKYLMDEKSDRVIFSFPFYDSMDVYRGTALFYVGARAIAEKLIAQGRLKISDNVSVIGDPAGILLGSPEVSKDDINRITAQVWRSGIQERVTLDSGGSGTNYSLITVKTNPSNHDGIFFGRLVNDNLFSVSEPMKLILNLSIFLTFFLTFYFLINLKPNPPAVVRNRLKRLKESLFEQLYVNKSNQERARWILELEQRRDEIRTELKYNLKLSSRQETIVNNIIDKSWDELLAVIKVGSGVVVHAKAVEVSQSAKTSEGIDEVEALEEISDIEEIEEVEEFGSASEEISDVEDIEELEELGESNVIDNALRAAIVPVQPYSVGLLQMATRFLSGKGTGKGLLKKASEKKLASEKGLLAKAEVFAVEDTSETEKPKKSIHELSSEIEFDVDFADEEEETQDLIVDIVSPFSSMFSALDKTSGDAASRGT